MKIGLLSDTHAYLHPNIVEHFNDVDEIWHAGDIGTTEITDTLSSIKKTRVVYGNIDGHEIRKQFPEYTFFTVQQLKILIIHIGGYPPHYNARSMALIEHFQPNLFICGHSHILKVIPDRKRNLLHLNPGACGKQGWHKKKTIMRFEIKMDRIDQLEIIELS